MLQYNTSGSANFDESNLQVTVLDVNGEATIWTPGMVNSGNLLGTIRTLDGVNGSVELNCTNQVSN